MNQEAEALLQFWFREIPESSWWQKSPAFDEKLRQRFGALHTRATHGELFAWRANLRGRLAEILLLDQLSRHLYRDRPEAFAWDGMALVLSQEAVRGGEAHTLPPRERVFLYMPHMHSESALVHEEALRLFSEPGLESNLDFERRHKAIIARFGRYPHRNAVLGRESTPEELAFLATEDSSF